jgi:flagellar assembly protein FliH
MDAVRAFELPPLEAPAGLAPVSAPAPAIDLAAEAAAARAAAHAEGYQAGLAEGRAALGPALQALADAAAAVAAERDRVCDEVEAAAVELGLHIAEQALAGALAVEPGRVVDVVRGALRRLVERGRITLLVHPDDLDIVREAGDGLVAELGGIEHLEVQADRRVARGGAVVRTAEGEVDATVATKLDRAREVLEEAVRDGDGD